MPEMQELRRCAPTHLRGAAAKQGEACPGGSAIPALAILAARLERCRHGRRAGAGGWVGGEAGHHVKGMHARHGISCTLHQDHPPGTVCDRLFSPPESMAARPPMSVTAISTNTLGGTNTCGRAGRQAGGRAGRGVHSLDLFGAPPVAPARAPACRHGLAPQAAACVLYQAPSSAVHRCVQHPPQVCCG